jgi:flagellar motor switch protein FliG
MFTFEDLTRLDAPGVQALQRAVEKERLTLALKGASEEIRNLFLSNMSQRAGRMLREDIAGLGPVRLRDVDEAQAAIVVLVKDMAGRGEVRLGDSRDDPLIT